jgi:hypothetical protein
VLAITRAVTKEKVKFNLPATFSSRLGAKIPILPVGNLSLVSIGCKPESALTFLVSPSIAWCVLISGKRGSHQQKALGNVLSGSVREIPSSEVQVQARKIG